MCVVKTTGDTTLMARYIRCSRNEVCYISQTAVNVQNIFTREYSTPKEISVVFTTRVLV